MATAGNDSGKRRRRRLTAAERYQVFLDVVSGHGSQREVADNARLREAIAEQAIELHLVRGKESWD